MQVANQECAVSNSNFFLSVHDEENGSDYVGVIHINGKDYSINANLDKADPTIIRGTVLKEIS